MKSLSVDNELVKAAFILTKHTLRKFYKNFEYGDILSKSFVCLAENRLKTSDMRLVYINAKWKLNRYCKQCLTYNTKTVLSDDIIFSYDMAITRWYHEVKAN